jgi:hypothetical protein
VSKPDLPQSVVDPDGRIVEFTDWSWDHIMVQRPQLLGDIETILGTIARPDHRERDPLRARERFYRRVVTDKMRWLRVVVDFSDAPAHVVTAFIQRKDPTRAR